MEVPNNNTFADNLCALMEATGTTQQQLSDKIGTTRQAISQYMNGDTEPKMKAFVAIAEYFNVSCDYLLGRARAAAPDDFIQAIASRYGLNDATLAALADIPAPDTLTGLNTVTVSKEQAQTIARRDVINFLLSHEQGKRALERLALYFFGRLDERTQKAGVSFELAIDTGEARTYINSAFVTDEEVRETLLRLTDSCFQALRQIYSEKPGKAPEFPISNDN